MEVITRFNCRANKPQYVFFRFNVIEVFQILSFVLQY